MKYKLRDHLEHVATGYHSGFRQHFQFRILNIYTVKLCVQCIHIPLYTLYIIYTVYCIYCTVYTHICVCMYVYSINSMRQYAITFMVVSYYHCLSNMMPLCPCWDCKATHVEIVRPHMSTALPPCIRLTVSLCTIRVTHCVTQIFGCFGSTWVVIRSNRWV